MEWTDFELMRDVIVVLNTLGWEKLLENNNPLDEILRLVTRFKVSLEEAEASAEKIYHEFTEMMDYAIHFISLSTLGYRSVLGGSYLMLLVSQIGKMHCFSLNCCFPYLHPVV